MGRERRALLTPVQNTVKKKGGQEEKGEKRCLFSYGRLQWGGGKRHAKFTGYAKRGTGNSYKIKQRFIPSHIEIVRNKKERQERDVCAPSKREKRGSPTISKGKSRGKEERSKGKSKGPVLVVSEIRREVTDTSVTRGGKKMVEKKAGRIDCN